MRKDDVIGISTMTFTPTGEAFYLSSSSELARVSMAAAYNLQATGTPKFWFSNFSCRFLYPNNFFRFEF